jgi:spermidine/putrescine transport system permease protein
MEVTYRPRVRAWVRLLPVVPVYLWVGLLVIVPNLFMIIYSFWQTKSGDIVHNWTLANYAKVAIVPTYQFLIGKTVAVAFAAALLAALVAYPMAYFVSRHLRRHKLTAVLLIVIPLWVSLLVRVFAWRIMLGESGILNSALVGAGILEQASSAFLYTPFTVFLTLTYVCVPFVFVTSYTALERIPGSLIEASEDSGANGWQTFRNVIWPLSRQGAALGFSLAFLVAVGDYVTPSMVGGLDGTMLGMVIASQFGLAANWPLGAAMAITLMIVVVVVLVVVASLTRTRGILESADSGMTMDPGRWRQSSWASRVGHIGAWVMFLVPYLVLYAPLAVIAIFYVLINFTVDILYSVLDPRIRHARAAA